MQLNHLSPEGKKEKSALDALKELENKPELEKPEDLVFKLVDNFHWIIQTERRRKGLSTKQLADMLGESEAALKLLEKGIVPNKAINLITAVEQFLKVRLIKKDFLNQTSSDKNLLTSPSSSHTGESPSKSPFIKKIEKDEINELLQTAISEEKNPVLNKLEKIGDYPLDANEFKKKEDGASIIDLRKRNELIDQDFNKKSVKTIGKEQTGDFGKDKSLQARRTLYNEKPKNSVPTIYELMKRKQERDKISVTGQDIDIMD
jgi:transcriptional regulator with XRE-family HTH domain